jgi:hypothetical protein
VKIAAMLREHGARWWRVVVTLYLTYPNTGLTGACHHHWQDAIQTINSIDLNSLLSWVPSSRMQSFQKLALSIR